MPVGYPTPTEVTAYLAAAGYSVPTGIDVQGEIDAAVATLESVSAKRPLLAGSSPTTLHLDPPVSPYQDSRRRTLPGYGQYGDFGSYGGATGQSWGGGGTTLDLGTRAQSVSSVILGSGAALPGPGPDGNSFWLSPRKDELRFAGPIYGAPGSVAVTGVFGWYADVPADVRVAVLRYAAGMILGLRREMLLSAGLSGYEEGGVSEKYDTDVIARLGAAWVGTQEDGTGAYATFLRYRKVGI